MHNIGEWTLHSIESLTKQDWIDWDRLNAENLDSHPLLSSRWARHLVGAFGGKKVRFARLARRDGSTLAACLIEPAGTGRWRIFCPAQAALALIVFDRCIAASSDSMQSLLRRMPGIPLVLDVPYQDQPFSCVAADVNACAHRATLGVTITISLVDGAPNYWSARPKELRDNIRRRERKATEAGLQRRLVAITDSAAIGAAVDRYGELESQGWKGKEGTALHPSNKQGQFYSDMMRDYAATGDACVFELWMSDRLAASRIVVSGPTMHVILKTTFDENLRNFAPGHLQLYDMLHQIMGEQRRAIELYTKATRDWLLWASHTRNIDAISFYRGPLIAQLAARRRKAAEDSAVAPTEVAE